MHSKRSQEGYLLLNHKDSPPIPDATLAAFSAATSAPPLPSGAGRGLFEAPTVTCSHCQKVSIINPLRNRERAYCAKCDHYICDGCGAAMKAGVACRPYAQLVAELYDQGARGEISHG